MRRLLTALAVPAAVLLAAAGCTTSVSGSGRPVSGASSSSDFGTGSPSPTDSGSDSSSSDSGGGGDADAQDLIDQMVDAMTSREHGFALKGSYDDSGQSAALDLHVSGDDGQGTVTINNLACQLVNVGGTGYANAPAAFWSLAGDLDDATAQSIAGKWVQLSGAVSSLESFVDQSDLPELFTSGEDGYTLGDRTSVAGVDAQEVASSDTTFTIASDDPHLLLKLSEDGGEVDFTFPDTDLTVSTPAGAIPYPG